MRKPKEKEKKVGNMRVRFHSSNSMIGERHPFPKESNKACGDNNKRLHIPKETRAELERENRREKLHNLRLQYQQ